MRILHLVYDHVNNPWVGGGGAVRVYEICRRLASSGHDVTVVSGRFPGSKDYKEGNLCYKFVGSSLNYAVSTLSYALGAAVFVRNAGNRYDIITEDFAPWNPVFSTLLTSTPAVLHINHREGSGILRRWWIFGLPFYLLEKWYPHLFGCVTALSEETRRKINIPEAFIVPAGINSGIFVDRETEYTEKKDETFILYVGRLHIKNKGLDVLLSAVKSVDRRLVLAGRGKDEKKLKEMAEKLGLADIEFAGFITEERKIALLRENCIFVLPSRFEGWGIVVLEAAACGKAVVVSDIPELRYAVDDGFGISFETGDPKDLAKKLELLLNNRPMRQDMGKKAIDYAKRFTWDRIADEYERFLLGIVKKNGKKTIKPIKCQ